MCEATWYSARFRVERLKTRSVFGLLALWNSPPANTSSLTDESRCRVKWTDYSFSRRPFSSLSCLVVAKQPGDQIPLGDGVFFSFRGGKGMIARKIVISGSCDAAYLPAACCQMKSVWDHLGERDQLRLCLVVCDVSGDDLKQAEQFFRERCVPAEIIVADDIAARIRPIKTRWPRAAYLRLH